MEPESNSTEYYLRRVIDASPSMLAYWDRNKVCRAANRAYLTWFGVDPEDLIGKHILDLLGPDLYAKNEPHIEGALRGEPQLFERVIPGPGGIRRHSLASYMPDLRNGEVVGFSVQVSEHIQGPEYVAQLAANERLLSRTVRLALVGGWAYDLRTQELSWSEQIFRNLEVPFDFRPTLTNAVAFYAPDSQAILQEALRSAFASGTPWDLELPLITAKGRRKWVRTLGEVEFENGVPVRLVGATQDITESRERRMELEREQWLRAQSEAHARELEKLLRERSDMLDVLAHEVRQPLNNASAALQAAAATLKDAGDSQASHRLARAQVVIGQVQASIDNTLALASQLAVDASAHREELDIATLLAVSVADMPAGERQRVKTELGVGARTAMMDLSLMRLALRNLLANALKYTAPERPVTLRVSDSDQPLAVLIDVEDVGSGIPEAQLAELFERHPTRRGQGHHPAHGLGLGLYIVRRVMELHAGEVKLIRNGPEGVTMRLVVPQDAVE